MNNSVKAKVAEAALGRLQRRWPSVFTDLCLYSEVSHLLAVYSFRLASRRFIQELFTGVDYSRCRHAKGGTVIESTPGWTRRRCTFLGSAWTPRGPWWS
jgi:rapamycin-insensitive companion of mTOR